MAYLGTDFTQLRAADLDLQHIVKVLPNRRERAMADAFQVSNQRREPGPDQSRLSDVLVDRREVHFLAMLTPTTQPTMFAHDDRAGGYLDLLDDPRIFMAQRDFAAAIGTALVVVVEKVIDFGFLERLSFMTWVSRLTTAFAFAFILLARGLLFGRFDDIAGGRFGRIARILFGFSQCGFQRRNALIQRLDLAIQRLTIRTTCRRLVSSQPLAVVD